MTILTTNATAIIIAQNITSQLRAMNQELL
jgi:hypothetical protein